MDRTIDCCRDALSRARDRAGIRLSDVDYVVLVGGSSRVPLVRETVRAAFCNPDLPEHVRTLEPLLHEPDLCVAYGAALRGQPRYAIPVSVGNEESGDGAGIAPDQPREHRDDPQYQLTGVVRAPSRPRSLSLTSFDSFLDGGSVRIRSLATGLTDEAFLDERGRSPRTWNCSRRRTTPWSWPCATAKGARRRASS